MVHASLSCCSCMTLEKARSNQMDPIYFQQKRLIIFCILQPCMQHTTTPFTFSAELVRCFSHKLIRTKGSYYCDTHAWTGKIEQNITISIAHEHTAHSEMMRTSLPVLIPAADLDWSNLGLSGVLVPSPSPFLSISSSIMSRANDASPPLILYFFPRTGVIRHACTAAYTGSLGCI